MHHKQRSILCSTTNFSASVSRAESKRLLQQDEVITKQGNYNNKIKLRLQQQNNFNKSFHAIIN
jgi:hypothetical protein